MHPPHSPTDPNHTSRRPLEPISLNTLPQREMERATEAPLYAIILGRQHAQPHIGVLVCLTPAEERVVTGIAKMGGRSEGDSVMHVLRVRDDVGRFVRRLEAFHPNMTVTEDIYTLPPKELLLEAMLSQCTVSRHTRALDAVLDILGGDILGICLE